jgi:hypothetical protein
MLHQIKVYDDVYLNSTHLPEIIVSFIPKPYFDEKKY